MSDLDARLIAAVKGETTEPTEDTFTSRLDAITEQLVKAAYEQGRDDARADIVNRVHELAFGDEEGNLWGVYDFIVGITRGVAE